MTYCCPQRADAQRLFFLHKYGGIYIDLDIECRRSLDFLRHYGWVMPQVGDVRTLPLFLHLAGGYSTTANPRNNHKPDMQLLSACQAIRRIFHLVIFRLDAAAYRHHRNASQCTAGGTACTTWLILRYDALQTKPVGFSNDFMVASVGHPFLDRMIAALPKWNKRFGSKYPTVMFSTGPMFVSYQVRFPACSCSGVSPNLDSPF